MAIKQGFVTWEDPQISAIGHDGQEKLAPGDGAPIPGRMPWPSEKKPADFGVMMGLSQLNIWLVATGYNIP